MFRRERNRNGRLFLILVLAIGATRACNNRSPSSRRASDSDSTPVRNPLEDVLKPLPAGQRREGIAAAILIDTSGSMKDAVNDARGGRLPKIQIAQRAALDLIGQVAAFAREHPDKTVMLGNYEFSQRRDSSSVRTVVKLGPPNASEAESAIAKMIAEGDTPIGDAMIQAKRDLDATGLSKRHILVLTDGENNKGYSPANVMQVLSRQSDVDRASVYFVAFDIAATKFNSVKEAGGMVLAASNATDLKGTLDYLLSGKILAEQPAPR